MLFNLVFAAVFQPVQISEESPISMTFRLRPITACSSSLTIKLQLDGFTVVLLITGLQCAAMTMLKVTILK